MNQQAISQHILSQHILLEHETLRHVTGALRHTIAWKPPGDDLSRKMSSLRFVAQSFQRHLERLMELEEEDGYLRVITETRPELSHEVAALGRQHDQFRAALADLLNRRDQALPADQQSVGALCDDLSSLLLSVDEHGKRETDLLQTALLQDEGGEG